LKNRNIVTGARGDTAEIVGPVGSNRNCFTFVIYIPTSPSTTHDDDAPQT